MICCPDSVLCLKPSDSIVNCMIDVILISQKDHLDDAFAVRREGFVDEQKVSPEDEDDEFEETSRHFLALIDGKPAGTSRWRRTSGGIKLERFAVRTAFRGKGVGKALVKAVLDDVFSEQPEPIERIYLHAQVSAMPLYAGFGFVPVGPMFEECAIQHFKMILPPAAYPHN